MRMCLAFMTLMMSLTLYRQVLSDADYDECRICDYSNLKASNKSKRVLCYPSGIRPGPIGRALAVQHKNNINVHLSFLPHEEDHCYISLYFRSIETDNFLDKVYLSSEKNQILHHKSKHWSLTSTPRSANKHFYTLSHDVETYDDLRTGLYWIKFKDGNATFYYFARERGVDIIETPTNFFTIEDDNICSNTKADVEGNEYHDPIDVSTIYEVEIKQELQDCIDYNRWKFPDYKPKCMIVEDVKNELLQPVQAEHPDVQVLGDANYSCSTTESSGRIWKVDLSITINFRHGEEMNLTMLADLTCDPFEPYFDTHRPFHQPFILRYHDDGSGSPNCLKDDIVIGMTAEMKYFLSFGLVVLVVCLAGYLLFQRRRRKLRERKLLKARTSQNLGLATRTNFPVGITSETLRSSSDDEEPLDEDSRLLKDAEQLRRALHPWNLENAKIYPISTINIDPDDCNNKTLGSGHYGVVYKVRFRPNNSAVWTAAAKGIKHNQDPRTRQLELESLLEEAKTMVSIGGWHENIVNLQGICASCDPQTGSLSKFYLILEFCAFGDLKSFLEKNHEEFHLDENFCSINCGFLNNGTLLNWALQVARGMNFLSENGSGSKIYHGDLAIRNVLLTEDLTAKVSDFGLAKRLYQDSSASLARSCGLPFRTMALELLYQDQASIKSDVWSFGVLMWEMFTLGDLPYYKYMDVESLKSFLKSGGRLPKPEGCPKRTHEVMLSCWDEDPGRRPTFRQLEYDLSCQIQMLEAGKSFPIEVTNREYLGLGDLYVSPDSTTTIYTSSISDENEITDFRRQKSHLEKVGENYYTKMSRDCFVAINEL